ncbi:MAG TPA: 8-oxo-dGTP diphosphatase MutT [Gammaproteobacteria bacterium]|nr:8-oxo-dGTP diphosphatase MutT [Gammaproteobacteria bacterium]|tara:strand:+ start:1284 stop:1709 length:426 start_codon:yes stop_codon:yes gene_type:complete
MPITEPEAAQKVAVGVVADSQGRLLIGERPQGKAYAGQWEFPGGKVEPGETLFEALVREFREELNLQVEAAHGLFSCVHVYPDREVELHFWQVTDYRGEARGVEGQNLRWVHSDDLASVNFLEGNRALLEKICALVWSGPV